jgi:PTS system ascorbate-specific IIB component
MVERIVIKMNPVKILTVCGMGVGSSMILRLQVEKAARALGLDVTVEMADISTAGALASQVDIILTAPDLAARLGKTPAKIITIKNFMSQAEMTEKLKAAIA